MGNSCSDLLCDSSAEQGEPREAHANQVDSKGRVVEDEAGENLEQENDTEENESSNQKKKPGGFMADLFGGESDSELGKIYESSDAPRPMKMYTDQDISNKTIMSFSIPNDPSSSRNLGISKLRGNSFRSTPSVTKMLVAPRRRKTKSKMKAASRGLIKQKSLNKKLLAKDGASKPKANSQSPKCPPKKKSVTKPSNKSKKKSNKSKKKTKSARNQM